MKNDEPMTRHSGVDLRRRTAKGGSGSDLARVGVLTPDEIERAAADQLAQDGLRPGWVASIKVVPARNKRALSLRLDPDLIDWFRATGPGYQTRINDVLRAYVQHEKTQERDVHPAL